MDAFWKNALKYGCSVTIAGLVCYTIYPQIIASPYLKNLTHNELFVLMGLIVIVVFGLCIALINKGSKRPAGNNTVNIKGSTVHGSVRAGNNTTNKK